jgi:predicted alpha/beta-hydrolase family hydrolase
MTRIEIGTPSGTAWADVERPPGEPVAAMFIGHGAGGGVEAPDVLAARNAALAAGFVVARITQPYRVAGRRSPAAAPRLDEAWLAATATLHDELGPLPTVHCGRSSGARVACRTAAETGAVAVIALAFPVHPPGKPERSRLDELALPTVPVLVVQGDRDPFGMPPEASGRRVVVVEGGDHSLRRGRAVIEAAVTDFLAEHVAQRR